MTDYPNKRDCEHGYQRGHCPYCDLAECERERDNAWDQYAEVCQEKADLEQRLNAWREGNCSCLARIEELKRELHEARESFADYAEEMGQRLDGLEQRNGDLKEENVALVARLVQAEQVVEAAKEVARHQGIDWETVSFADAHADLCAALAEEGE